MGEFVTKINSLINKIMVKTEVPYFRRCCFCLPLRRGLLAWGYFKLVLLFLIGVIDLFHIVMHLILGRNDPSKTWVFLVLSISYVVLELVLTNVLLIGSHTKNSKILRVYFYFMLVNIPGLVCFTIYILVSIINFNRDYETEYVLLLHLFCFMCVYIVVNIYVVMLLRSEMKKLNDNSIRFEFLNNVDNPECSLSNE